MNLWAFTGNLGSDAESKALSTGTSVLEFSVAVASGYGDKQKTTWARCALFGKRAEGALKGYLVKGQKVAVTGEATLEEWEDKKSGGTKSAMKVSVHTIDLIGEKKTSDGAPARPNNTIAMMQNAKPTAFPDEDIPW